MQNERHSSPARLIAPLALALFALAFFAVLVTAGGGGEDGGKKKTETTERTATKKQPERQTTTTTPGSTPATYTVKTGDTLAGIAEDTGVEVEKIQEFNPQLDPQALVSGQKIKLRE